MGNLLTDPDNIPIVYTLAWIIIVLIAVGGVVGGWLFIFFMLSIMMGWI